MTEGAFCTINLQLARACYESAWQQPPFFATISLWKDSAASMTYAFGRGRPQHSNAITEQARKDFHRQSAFVRFAPIRIDGSLGGANPLPAAIISASS